MARIVPNHSAFRKRKSVGRLAIKSDSSAILSSGPGPFQIWQQSSNSKKYTREASTPFKTSQKNTRIEFYVQSAPAATVMRL